MGLPSSINSEPQESSSTLSSENTILTKEVIEKENAPCFIDKASTGNVESFSGINDERNSDERVVTTDEGNNTEAPNPTPLKEIPYLGDVDKEVDLDSPLDAEGYAALSLKDPAQVLELFDVDIREQRTILHKWQIEVAEELGQVKPTSLLPYKFALCACNGSGKDAFVIAPFVIWFALTKVKSLTIITSSSGVQLTAQTEGYIKRLAQAVNTLFGQTYFKINQRYIKCLKTGSEIRLFATDEAGKAEGYHPLTALGEMAIIVNEAKSVSSDIFKALKRCTGFNYWLDVSTPGEPYGNFYYDFTNWEHKRHVTTYDCPHQSPSEREADRIEFGEHSAIYRSKHLALFTTIGGTTILTEDVVNDIIKNPPIAEFQSWPLRIGGDLAAGGDECVITATKGNKITSQLCFTQRDTTISADIIERHLLTDLKLSKTHEHLYFDDGGVGRGIIDMLIRRGWNVKRILNQHAASNKREFGNRGAEAWFRLKRIVEELLFDLRVNGKVDEKLVRQLVSRHYKKGNSGSRIFLEKKQEAKAHGRPSPDRADSLLLSLTGLTIDDFLKTDGTTKDKILTKPRTGNVGIMTPEEFAIWYEENETFKNSHKAKDINSNDRKVIRKPLCGSISAWLNRN